MSSPLRRLIAHTSEHRRTVWLASACSVLNKLFDLAPPGLIGMAIDVVVKREDSLIAAWGFPDPVDQLMVLTVLTVAVWAAESFFEYAFGVLWRNLAQTVQHELRLEAYGHIQDLDMAWYADQSKGELMSVLNDDVNQLERFLDGGANDILQVVTTAIAVSITFFFFSPIVAMAAIAPVPFVIGGSFWFQGRIAPRYLEVRDKVAKLNATLASNLEGIATIKAFVTEDRELNRLRSASDAYREANRGAIRLSAAFSPLIRMIIVVGFTATMLGGGWLALNGQMEVGVYAVLVFLTQRLLWPLTRLGSTFDLYQRAMASTSRVLDLVDTPVLIVDGKEVAQDRVRGDIVFEDVRFAYPDREPLLDRFNLTVPAGKTTAIVGHTGSGKTTLVRLLLRFFDPQAGRVTMGGLDVRELQLGELRRAIGMVSQQTILFPGSVRDNIAYARPEATADEVEAAAQAAEAHEFVSQLPQGYDTIPGESGLKLSGGQRQRLTIARAVLDGAPILVLDEATSAVDNETEAALQRSLATLSKGRTALVIAHRLSTIRNADQIVVLDAGCVAEKGTHDELVALGGLYSRLWAVQTGVAA